MGFCLIAAVDLGLLVVILQVAIALGLVIFVHELGHFAVAKWCGVKCEKFYLGFDFFGWKLFRYRWGETEYGIGIFPLGGYVKMLGQEDNPARLREEIERARQQEQTGQAEPAGAEAQSGRSEGEGPAEVAEARSTTSPEGAAQRGLPAPSPEDVAAAEKALFDPRSYLSKSVPQRMAIISAGVIMNLVFAFCCAVVAYGIGVRQIECGVGNLIAGDAAWQAGFEVGDRITEINGRRVEAFRELQEAVALGDAGEEAAFVVERFGEDEPIELRTRPDLARGRPTIGITNPYTTSLLSKKTADRAGLEHPSEPGAPARDAQPPFQFADRVVAIDGQPIGHYAQIDAFLAAHPERELTFSVERRAPGAASEADTFTVVDIRVAPNPARRLGLVMTMGDVTAVRNGSPAATAGVRPGDRLAAIDGQPPGDPILLPDRLRRRTGEKVTLQLRREDEAPREVQVVVGPPQGAAISALPGNPLDVPVLGLAYQVHARVAEVLPGSPAARAGLRAGDTITEAVIAPPADLTPEQKRLGASEMTVTFNDDAPAWPAFSYRFQQSLPGSTVTLTTGDGRTITLEPVVADDWHLAGRGLVFEPPYFYRQAHGVGEALALGGRETFDSVAQVYLFLRRIGTQISPRQLGGPITIARAAGHFAYEGFAQFLIFITLLSANLAVINFLPIPLLDGGHIVFLAYEGIRGKPADERVQIILTYLGLAFILTLMVWVIGLDIGLIDRN
ncbi:MAG: site-2 protease family protein [Thermoguttaceae bacterium]|nr:site-2 protease family protein [Thermoguttaceae bacterium]